MEVRPGYKLTELGALPEDWVVQRLSDVSWFQEGPGVRNTQFTSSGVKLLNGTNIFRGELDLDATARFISTREAQGPYAHFLADEGDIVIASSGITVQRLHEKVAFVRAKDLPLCMNTSTIRFKPHADFLVPEFLFQFLTSDGFKRSIGGQATGSAQLNFGPSHVARVPMVVPPLSEQRAIAETLSDVDALLGALDELIAKKRDLKWAAMHQLLTGQTRLPGFHGQWVVKQLGELIEQIGDGATPSTADRRNFGGGINWVVIDDIKDEITTTATTLTERGLRSCAATLWKPGTLIVSTGATIGEVGIARIPVATKQGICGLVVDHKKATAEFLKYWLVQNRTSLLSKAQGSTIKEVRAPTLVKFELPTPSIDEQDAIAAVVSHMDAELSALEARRDKTHALKQAMMQELLTGRTRLV